MLKVLSLFMSTICLATKNDDCIEIGPHQKAVGSSFVDADHKNLGLIR